MLNLSGHARACLAIKLHHARTLYDKRGFFVVLYYQYLKEYLEEFLKKSP